MTEIKIEYLVVAVSIFLLPRVAAQEQFNACYGPGSIVGAVIGTLIITLGIVGAGLFVYRTYRKNRKGKHLVLVTDTENPNDQYAFDNPCFREPPPIKQNIDEKQTSKLDKNKWLGWTSLHSFGKDHKKEKIISLDDNNINDSRLRVVTLKSHDFTGLGFNICGNMRDGIFVKDVLHRGPAFESGCINSGDRIHSVCINFKNMVFEDALMILSYASPYDVQVQIENDSNASKPSTLLKSKRESNIVSSSEKICHPKYNRSQSISYLNEIGKTNNKQLAQQVGFMQEKNRINQSLNKLHENRGSSNDYPTIKLSPRINEHKKERQNLEKNAASVNSQISDPKKLTNSGTAEKQITPDHGRDLQNKFQKFGIKVLPISNPKMGVQSVTGSKKPIDEKAASPKDDNKINLMKEKPEKLKANVGEDLLSSLPRDSTKNEFLNLDEPDMAKENVKGIFTKGFQNLKEKINHNSLGKRRKDAANDSKDSFENHDDEKANATESETVIQSFSQEKINSKKSSENDCPVPKSRSNLPCGTKVYEKSLQNQSPTIITMPEEVSKAGDVAKSNRRSITDPSNTNSRRSVTNLNMTLDEENLNSTPAKEKTLAKKFENGSESESSSDIDLSKVSDETKRPKKSKGKAPAPPGCDSVKEEKPPTSLKESINEISKIKEKSELVKGEKSDIFEPLQPDTRIIRLKKDIEDMQEKNHFSTYDSDSDTEATNDNSSERANSVKIELNATQVTVHQSSIEEGNDEDVEPSRKAASLGDLSRLDSEQPLSIVLERAVSLDLADGTSQKKRKAPMPPSEEFPNVFDDLNYRKEPRLEHPLGLNSFQCRLKKSSDFGTLEDVLNDSPKSLEIEINKPSLPINLAETHNNNIQEFSSWLAECRRPKSINEDDSKQKSTTPTMVTSTSLVNISSFDNLNNNNSATNELSRNIDCQGNNVSFSVNGKNFSDFKGKETVSMEEQEINLPGASSKTVVVISQPNSLEPTVVEAIPMNFEIDKERSSILSTEVKNTTSLGEEDTTLEPFVTARDFLIENFKEDYSDAGDTPPRLPSSPMPVLTTSGTVSSPLSSSLTYITEIKVSTSQMGDLKDSSGEKTDSPLPSPSSDQIQHLSFDIVSSTPLKISEKPEKSKTINEKIQQFDNKLNEIKPPISPIKPKPIIISSESKTSTDLTERENFRGMEASKIPIRTMKSETGQKVLATIQSLAAKKLSPTKNPEVEYAKRMASLFSGNNSLDRAQISFSKETEDRKNDDIRPNVSGFYLKGPEVSPKPSQDFLAIRKVPPVVPPRKMESFLSESKSSGVSLDVTSKNQETLNDKAGKILEKNIVTFSSFPNSLNEESGNSTLISFKIKNNGQVNGSHSHEQCNVIPVKPFTQNIVFENKGHKDSF